MGGREGRLGKSPFWGTRRQIFQFCSPWHRRGRQHARLRVSLQPRRAGIAGADRNDARALATGSVAVLDRVGRRSEEHTSELQSLMRISYAVLCLKKKKSTPGSA